MRHSLSTTFGSQRRAITLQQLRVRIHAPFARANDGGRESNKTRMGDDGEGKKTRARPGRNRSPRRELQGNPAEVRTRARSVLRDDPGQRAERIRPALVLALRRNRSAFALSPRNPRRDSARRIPGAAGTKSLPPRFSLKCSNLARGESMKDPVCIFECRRGFSLWSRRPGHAIASHAIGRV